MSTVELGRMCELEVVEISDQGAFVDAQEHGALFVPRSQLPKDLVEGDTLRVFLYVDGHRVLATARHPYLEANMVGRLKVTAIECGTVYMDLGIPKELVVPVSEQRGSFEVGRTSLIYITLDAQGRLFGTQKLNKYISDFSTDGKYQQNQKVKVVPVSHTPLGFRCVINDEVYGLVYKDRIHEPLIIGKRYEGYILNVRDDGRIDISMQELGHKGIERKAFSVLQACYDNNGILSLNDKSAPEIIEDSLHMSKAAFKKIIGHLYKHRLIVIKSDSIAITDQGIKEIKSRHNVQIKE